MTARSSRPPLRWHWLWERRRRALLEEASAPAMVHYLEQCISPFDAVAQQVTLLAVDLETTGLDPQRDDIVSIGAVVVAAGHVHLDSAFYQVVQSERPLTPESVTIHRITDDAVAAGLPLPEAMAALLGLLGGKVLLVHGATLDLGMLQAASRRVFGQPLLVPVVDTLALELARYRRRGELPRSDALRLSNLREQYGLPPHALHHALADAVATAELFLAQLSHFAGDKPLSLRSVLS